MMYPAVAIVLAILAALIVLLGLRILLRGHWLLGFVRGATGIAVVALAAVVALSAWDLRSYRELLAEQPIATLTFNRLEPQHFGVLVTYPDGREQRTDLDGDLWQLDVRMLKWTDSLARLGLKPGYRLDRLSGRYLSLEDEQNKPHSAVALDNDRNLLDTWYWLRRFNQQFSLLDAQYGSAAFMPMADGAMFSVALGPSGLVARPLNDSARIATQRWN